jgi:tRNA A-37 threonylcarbamoyl transferase component Bud32/Tfp pilus assembly protein PilF
MILPLQQIEGKYEALAKLGEGGMGAVYKVRHRLLDEIRVIKIMRSSIAEDEDARARFLREARAASRLRHPNIAQLYDFSVDGDGTSYIVMEYVEGVTLEELLRRRGPASIALTLEIAIHSLRALESIHREQMVHRDIAPDNLMLTRDPGGRPFVKLIDLGIAKSLESEHTLTEKGMFIGKMRYASPEQFGGSEGGASVDPRSDLYSFGVVLYELLTGTYPIAGKDFQTLIAGHLFRPPKPFEESDPQERVPARLRAAVLTALAKQPAERFESAAAFTVELEEILAERRAAGSEDPVAEVAFVLESLRRGREEVEARPGSTQDRLDMRFAVADPTGAPATEEGPEAPADETPTRMLETADREAVEAEARRERLAQLLREGRNFLALGEVTEARKRAAQALEQDPEATGALSLSREIEEARHRVQLAEARERLERGELEAAREVLLGVLDRAPGDSGAQALLQEVEARHSEQERSQRHDALLAEARGHFARGDLERATAGIERVLEEDPEHVDAVGLAHEIEQARHATALEEARQLLEEGEPSRARQRLESVLARAPSHPEAQALLEAVGQTQRSAEDTVAQARELLAADELQAARGCLDQLPAEHRRSREVARLEKEIGKAEERSRKAEEARRLEESRRREEEERRAEEARLREEESRRVEEERRRAEEVRQAEEARRLDRARREEEVRAREEQRRVHAGETTPGGTAAVEREQVTGHPRAERAEGRLTPARELSLSRLKLPLVAAGVGLLAIGLVVALLLIGRALSQRSEEPTPPLPAVTARLLIDSIPWAEVIRIEDGAGREIAVEGDRHTPLAVAVEPGEYTVVLRHPVHGEQSCAGLVVQRGEEATCTLHFAKVDLERYFQEAGW